MLLTTHLILMRLVLFNYLLWMVWDIAVSNCMSSLIQFRGL